jgi:hypothetical protein
MHREGLVGFVEVHQPKTERSDAKRHLR